MKKSVLLTVCAITLVACVLSFTACNATSQYFVFGTSLEIDTYGVGGGDYADSVVEYMQSVELAVSAVLEGSDIRRINDASAGESVKCSDVTMELLAAAQRVYELTDGAYDPSVYPLVELWGFSPDKFVAGKVPEKLPTDDEISAVLGKVGFADCFEVDYETATVTKLRDGAELDLGGIAKGFAVSRAVSMADGKKALVNLGGNIGAANGTFKIGVASPREYSKSYIGIVPLSSGYTMATSGDYEKYYIVDGVRYHHIIDPFTGRPAASGLISVTVVTSDGALGDALATAIMVAGEEKGLQWAQEAGVGLVLVREDTSVSTYNVEYTPS